MDDDLYSYDGPLKSNIDRNNSNDTERGNPRQDFDVDSNALADVMHYDVIRTLFIPQAIGNLDSKVQYSLYFTSCASVDDSAGAVDNQTIANLRKRLEDQQ